MFNKIYIALIIFKLLLVWWNSYFQPSNDFQIEYQNDYKQRIILIFGDNNYDIQIERIGIASYYTTKNSKFVINNNFIDNIDIYMDYMAIVLNTSTVKDTIIAFNVWLRYEQYLLNSKLDIIIICNDTDIDEIVEMNNLYYNGTNNNMRIVSIKI